MRDPLKGSRATRHGYVHRFAEIRGCSPRHLKTDLEATKGEDGIGLVHLCASIPCTLPDDGKKMVHIDAPTTLDYTNVLNVEDAAKLTLARYADWYARR